MNDLFLPKSLSLKRFTGKTYLSLKTFIQQLFDTGEIIAPASTPEYLEYLAYIGEDDPNPVNVTVINSGASNYLGDIVWTISFDDLVGTKVGAFTTGKTFISVTEDWNAVQYGAAFGGTFEEDTVYVRSVTPLGDPTSENTKFYVMIRVYP